MTSESKHAKSLDTQQLTPITSATNAEVKQLRSLHERKYRRKTGWFLAEGMRICTEALHLGHAPVRIVYAAGRELDPGLAALITACRNAGGRVLPVAEHLLSRISRKENAQMVIGAFAQKWTGFNEISDMASPASCWVALDRVRDPGNLGTIMRTADAVAAKGIILIDDCTDPYSIEAVRASMGAVFNVCLVQTTAPAFSCFCQRWPGSIIGTALQDTVDYRQADWSLPLVLLMGNEQAGLSDEMMGLCTQLVHLPMRGRSDSLNLAVATGVCLYEMLKA
jgi:TrmH family RNA methyltransferase